MSVGQNIAAGGDLAFRPEDRERFARHAGAAGVAARRLGRGVLASVTVAVAADVDPSGVVAAGRRAGDRWFCFEQPDRERSAVAGVGAAAVVRADGAERFARAGAQWRRLVREACADELDDGPPGAGLVALGGFAFAPDGAGTATWRDFEPAALTVPEVGFARRGAQVRMTVAALVAPDDTVEDVLARTDARLGELAPARLGLLDPAPVGRHRVGGPMPPEHYESAVARAVEQIRAGAFDKVVLAREVQVQAPAPYDPGAIYGVLREAFPACYVYCAGVGDAAFVGASPEVLVRRDGLRATTVALAGSTRRSADPAVDDHLGERLLRSAKDRGEQAIVTRRIMRTLRPHSVWVTAPPEPAVIRIANIQHLATPIRAQLAAPIGAVDLAGILHPTPAVGGEPWAAAAPSIPALEGLDRGWYAGPLGWTDAAEDGEFCVALRCALLRGADAHCYAGVGVVADSDPAAELAETEIKLQALLPLLAS